MARGGRPGFPTRPPERLAAAPKSKFLSDNCQDIVDTNDCHDIVDS